MFFYFAVVVVVVVFVVVVDDVLITILEFQFVKLKFYYCEFSDKTQ